jgi:thymidylate synthase (FAD)
MNVELIACSRPLPGRCGINKSLSVAACMFSNPMRIIEQAASVCYDSEPDFAAFNIAETCAKTGHLSVYEHSYFTFHVTGVSRACLAQLTRHRHFSFSVRSQRYCDESFSDPVFPAATNSDQDGIIADAYDYAWDAYDRLIKDGVAKEDARMVLPNGAPTELYVSMNARALIEASHLRLCRRAQFEIRSLFMAMQCCVAPIAPDIANMMVPQCETNPQYQFCTEGKSCGKHPRLQDVLATATQKQSGEADKK